ncbi:MAG: prepilin peptidase [bacterium]|nr:prepilin peptidase [bacterium]
MSLAILVTLAASSAAAVADLRSRRIPNAIPIALGACGTLLTAFADPIGIFAFLGIALGVLVLGSALHARGFLGGGDVKLFAAVAATLGLHDLPLLAAATLIAGGVLGVAFAVARGRLRATALNLHALALPMLAGVRPLPPRDGTPMPYALAIFSGVLAVATTHVR